MKLLIQSNNDKWTTWEAKLKQLKDWFAPALTLDITLEHTSISNIPWSEADVLDGNGNKWLMPNPSWFDVNITKPALFRGFDCVIFVIEPAQWKGNQVQGLGTHPNMGIEEIQMLGNENAEYNFMGKVYSGGQFFNIARHELIHRIYNMLKLPDLTHIYFNSGNLEQCLKELKEPSVNPLVAQYRTYKYFKPSEIVGLKPELVTLLDKLRGECGFPFIINSGYRTKAKNNSLSDAVNDSAHLGGLAADLSIVDSFRRYTLINKAILAGISRIGVGKNFIHIDISKTLPQNVIWTYN